MAKFDDLPPEILRIITQLIYLDHLPRSLFRCIDPHGLPSTYPDGRLISATQTLTKSTLHSLCLTNVALYQAARPLLWRRLQITLPYSFLLLLRSLGASRLAEAYEQLGGPEKILEESQAEDEGQDGAKEVDLNERMSFNAMLAAIGLARVTGSAVYTDRKPGSLQGITDDENLELVWTEEPLLQGSGHTSRYQVTLRQDESEISDVHRYPRVLDFSTFTTQGMRRTVGQGEQARFVTPAKLLALITSVSHGLMAFGASPTMDSALTLEVLETLLFRDGEHLVAATSTGTASPHRTLRGVSMERSRERKDQERRRLESLDLCDCVSRHFEVALTRFVEKYLKKFSGRTTSTVPEEGSTEDDEEEEDRRGRGRSRGRNGGSESGSRPVTLSRSISTRRHAPSIHPARATKFPSVERLCLYGVHFSSELLSPFILAFPRLTHLDLTGTRIDDALLQGLMANPDLELESLSLARCTRITSECITELLVDSSVCANLIELSLEGTLLFPTPVTQEDLKTILTMAPCMRSGALRYLDLSGCGLTNTLLAESFQRQPSLIDFGISATPQVSLESLADFLLNKAPNVQVLEMVDSCVDPRQGTHPTIVKLNGALLEPCASVPPLSISEQLAALGYSSSKESLDNSNRPRPSARTNLRVLGLSPAILRQAGALGSWRVIMGKGRRGWLVDTSSGPDPDAVDDDLEGEETEEAGESGVTSSIFGNPSANRGKVLESFTERRGRDSKRNLSGFEPETPPRRLSRSPSVHRSLSRTGRNSSLLRRATSSSHSRSRPAGQTNSLSVTGLPAHAEMPQGNATVSAGESALTEPEKPVERKAQVIRNLPKEHPRRKVLEDLSRANGHVAGTTGWHSKKMEVLLGLGMLGRENGSYAYAAYQA